MMEVIFFTLMLMFIIGGLVIVVHTAREDQHFSNSHLESTKAIEEYDIEDREGNKYNG